MDLKLHRPQAACAVTGRPFVPGEIFFSAVLRQMGAIERRDVGGDAWHGAPEGTIAWWRSRYPAAEATGPALAPVDVLLDALEGLEGSDDHALRYLLALQLVRRRALRIVDDAGETVIDEGELLLSCRKRDRDYRVTVVSAEDVAADGVEQRLTALLWSGDAA